MWLQTMAFERGPAKRVILTLITLGYDFAQSHFDKGIQGCLFLLRQFARFLEKAVRYMYGCLHAYTHIILYGNMSRHVSTNNDKEEKMKHSNKIFWAVLVLFDEK